MENEETLYYQFEQAPYIIETLALLKEKGIKLAICSNSNVPARNRQILKNCGFNEEMFDIILISGEIGIRKPNPAIIDAVKANFPGIKDY